MMKHTKVKTLLQGEGLNETVCVKGWVRTKRGSKNVSFIAINDGSTINNIQAVAESESFDEELIKQITTGACLRIVGTLVESQGSGQKVEITAQEIEVLGDADADVYPLQPKKHSLEFLREKAHLRFRTNTFSAVFRVRHALSFAIHKFFNDKGFVNLHTPIITGADAEGAGEMFQVSSLDWNNLPKDEDGNVDETQDFFAKKTNLTVSGQLEAELGALALGQVYTFGPTFRAENSNTSRHLSEFWMIEPEVAFNDLNDNMDLAEDFLKYCIKYVLEHCKDDIAFLDKRLTDEFKKPVILTDYPKNIKAFYMRMNEDGETVRAMDILFPGIGEIVGGSQREERMDILKSRMEEMDVDQEELWWYLETRQFGTCPHSGFGLGFERLIMFVTGMKNVRDVIPFPRYPQNAEF